MYGWRLRLMRMPFAITGIANSVFSFSGTSGVFHYFLYIIP
jgi:hypothetical protein